MNNLFQITGTYTDQYQLTMAQAYFSRGEGEQKSIFDYFFRKLPYGGGYAIFAGIENLLEILENFQFNNDDLEFMSRWGFDSAFIEYLKNFRFKGSIYSSQEGDIVFPIRPILRVEGTIIETQIIETLLLNILNFQTLIATKASRIRLIAGNRTLIDFGMRRAHGLASYYASRAAIIGGFNATSNVKSGMDFNIPVSGTMAHSFIQSYDDEINAFRHFAQTWPQNCILLVDTYSTLKKGLPNAIKVAKEMESRGDRLKGIRLDSGDLAYLSKKSRQLLDDAGLNYVKIFASNQLDEFVIKSLLEQKAPIDGFGVGTSLVTGQPDAALDGVYKLAFAFGKPRIKLSENTAKTTLPNRKQVYRMFNSKQELIGADMVTLSGENAIHEMYHPFDDRKRMSLKNCTGEPLLHQMMDNGKRTTEPKTAFEIAQFSKRRLDELPQEYKRFDNPHNYKVGLSGELRKERNHLIDKHC
jgi:nicotinate phosphoribosyltransferase